MNAAQESPVGLAHQNLTRVCGTRSRPLLSYPVCFHMALGGQRAGGGVHKAGARVWRFVRGALRPRHSFFESGPKFDLILILFCVVCKCNV